MASRINGGMAITSASAYNINGEESKKSNGNNRKKIAESSVIESISIESVTSIVEKEMAKSEKKKKIKRNRMKA